MLQRQILQDEIRKLNDSTFEQFVGFPATCSSAAKSWSNAYYLYAKDILPTTTTSNTAKNSAEVILKQICSSNNFDASVLIFENSIKTFAMSLIPGMLPTFTGIMPTRVLNLRPIFLRALNGASAKQFAEEFSDEVDVWFMSGTAINVNSSVIINWK